MLDVRIVRKIYRKILKDKSNLRKEWKEWTTLDVDGVSWYDFQRKYIY